VKKGIKTQLNRRKSASTLHVKKKEHSGDKQRDKQFKINDLSQII
jgi:hypothetical protein